MRHLLLGLALTLGASIGCGGDDDGSAPGGDPLTDEERDALCAERCDYEVTCLGNDEATCLEECDVDFDQLAGDQVTAYTECITASCDTSEDACLLDVNVRDIDEQYAEACAAWLERCGVNDTDGLCDLEEPEGGALVKLLTADGVQAVVDCMSEACDDIFACINELGL